MEISNFSNANTKPCFYGYYQQGLAELTMTLDEKGPKVLSSLSNVFQLSCSQTPSQR